jgi:creatinine amidohydrolase/Fe(II)-dependent formamide hydrolase-like protein
VGDVRAEGRDCRAWHAGLPKDQLAAAGLDARVADPHAGRFETSLLLALAPGLVRLDLAAPGDTRPLAEILPALRSSGVRAVSPGGVLGDPSGASADEGRTLLGLLVASLGEAIEAATR